ncbi:zinc finger CCCH domain-containing protein 7B-like [Centroberyx gerrardi]
MDSARQKRKEEIQRSLTFIQSSLPYPEPEGYEDFLTQLVCNLLEEGNASFRDRDWERAAKDFSEGLNVTRYAAAEQIQVPEALLESLYVNRASAYHSMGEFERGVQDCDSALEVCKEIRRALYRKALCLKELGQYKEAYNCTTDCLLITRLDKQVNELAQELAVHLGLKNRKAYVSTKEEPVTARAVRNGNMTAQAVKVSGAYVGNGLNPLSGVAPVGFPSMPQSSIQISFSSMTLPSPYGAHGSSAPLSCHQPAALSVPDPDALEDSELMGEDLDSLLDCFPNEPEPTETDIQAAFPNPSCKSTCAPAVPSVPSVLPAPTPQLPPAFFNSAVSQLNSLDTFSASGGRAGPKASTLDALDALSTSDGLDALDSFSSGLGGNAGAPKLGLSTALNTAAQNTLDGLDSLDDLLDSPLSAGAGQDGPRGKPDSEEKSLNDCLDALESVSISGRSGDVPKIGVNTLKPLDSLDALDSFHAVKGVKASALPAVAIGGGGLDSLSDFGFPGVTPSHSAAAPAVHSAKNNYKEKNNQVTSAVCNPLSSTHDFMQACSACFPREGRGIYTYVHKPDLVHSCKRDILLCRRKAGFTLEWTRVRRIPSWNSFSGPFKLCTELLKSGDLGLCKFGEKCTFAFNQLEIDVWTEERKGTLDRILLFEPAAVRLDPILSVVRLLQEHKGMFMFLCQECYDSKPRIISKRCRDNRAICSNPHARHTFDANKCLAYVVMTTTVNYSKIRPLNDPCHLDLCRQAIRYGCQREDNCHYAHSVIELKTWRLQENTGITPDEIVKESIKYYGKQEHNSTKQKVNKSLSAGVVGGGANKPRGGGGGGKSLNMKMKFACAQCWRDGLISEPDKALKYCTARARHIWIKERRVLLVKSLERNKWVQVRAPPFAKNYPLQYDICTQILKKKKCTYTGNCTFAHSQEEKELWTYMKNNDLSDMQQIYDMWLSLSGHNRQSDGALLTQTVALAEEKCIVMPTDYADPMIGFHCRLCGRHSNSERQWQQHISSEKHKDRVFSCEGEEETLTWSYRFPGPCFEICPKLDSGCAEGASCDFAHSAEELQEWLERRDFLRRKLAKARGDMLIMPDEFDFGKYNFLLQD